MRGLRFFFLLLTISFLGGSLGGSLGLAHAAEPTSTPHPDLKTMAIAIVDSQSPHVTSADAPDAADLAALIKELQKIHDRRVQTLLDQFTPKEIAYMYDFAQTPAGKSIAKKRAQWFYNARLGPHASVDALIIDTCGGIWRPY